MEFNLKQWRDESEEEEQESPRAKLQRLNNPHYYSSDPALPLFVPDPTTTTASPTKLISPRMGSYFSVGQWQELELQALIYRHMMAGAAVPPELLHLVNKTLISSPPTPYYYQYPSLVQRGYWGKAAMDPEPGRCRRTDGKKWRCSRDVVVAHKYCERHMHRGKNRSRKPVEISSTSPFTLSTSSHHPHTPTPRPLINSMAEPKYPFQPQNNGQNGGDPTLRHFFDDWPRSLDEADNAAHSATNLSISTSDFSLKLGTSNGDECRGQGSRPQMNWGMAWETAHRQAQMGGPLAEALRSSMSTSSPTSVLHRLQRSSASETSFASS